MKKMMVLCLLLAAISLLNAGNGQSRITMKPFGETEDGKSVYLYSLQNSNGMKVDIMNYGCTVVRLFAPDRTGEMADVVLGFNTLEEYVEKSPYFGCIVGRYGNRIANGQFTLNGTLYKLATNNEPGGIPCHLHGGLKGFDKVVWDARPGFKKNNPQLELQYTSMDGEEGYPGTLYVTVCYRLTDSNELVIEYSATTDKSTPVNLTHHTYFNLHGEGNGHILDHILFMQAKNFTPVTRGLIPTGEIRPVKGTPFDFTKPNTIGKRINSDDQQIKFGGGYDHNWVLDKNEGLQRVATVYETYSGRYMEVWTTEPGLQFYSGNFLDGTLTGKSGKIYPHRSGLCLETQHFPDSPNQPSFPGTILNPGEVYKSTTVYCFSVK